MLIDTSPDTGTQALEWLRFASIVLLGIVAYFLKRCLNDSDDLKKEVQDLKTSVAIVIDRDRRKRLADYDAEDSADNGGGK